MGLEKNKEAANIIEEEDMQAFLYYVKRFFSYSGRVLHWNIVGMGLMSFVEGFGILLLIPMLAASGMVKMEIGGTQIKRFLEFMNTLQINLNLPLILTIFVLLVLFQNIIDKQMMLRNAKITQGFIGQIRKEANQNLLFADWNFYLNRRKSDLINILTIELARVAGGINQFVLLLSSLIFLIIQVMIALFISVKMTLFVLLSGIVLQLFSRKYIKQSKTLGKKTSVLAQEYLAGITDQLNGMKEIKSNTLEGSRINWLNGVVQGMFMEQIEYIKLRTASQIFYKMSSTILIALFIYFSVTIFNSQPGQFLLILVLFSRLWPRVTALQSSLEQLASTLPAFKALLDLQTKSMQAQEIASKKSYAETNQLIIEKGIECKNVSFRYNKNEFIYAVKDINFTIPANKMTAIVGSSGAGKSTLVDIIMGLNQPEQGGVFIDDTPVSDNNLLSFRRGISYVPQDPFLFNVSVKDNLQMGESHFAEEDIWNALEKANADFFVKRLPQGLNTVVGDRGIRLSGGERQRLVLARALLRRPSILVLDEATSALDAENESKIQEVIENLKNSMTIIIIAHRLSTIRNADQMIVLNQGKIIQKGSYNQLATKKV